MRGLIAVLILLPAGLGCAGPVPAPQKPWTFVHPESAKDERLRETLAAVPPDWRDPTAIEIVAGIPLVVPNTLIVFAVEAPGALAAVAMLPVNLVSCLLETFGLIDRAPARRPDAPDRPR